MTIGLERIFRWRFWTVLSTGLGLVLSFGCVTHEYEPDGRTRETVLPARIRSHFDRPGGHRVAASAVQEKKDGHEVRLVGLDVDGRDGTRRRLQLEWYRVSAKGRHPAIVVTPILDGKNELARILARALVKAGYSAVILANPPEMLEESLAPAELELAFRDSILDLRRVVDWLVVQPGVDPARLGSAGISLGAIRNAVLAAVEPRLKVHVWMLGGTDLPTILLESVEKEVGQYRAHWVAEIGEDRFEQKLREAFFYDGAALFRTVDPSAVYMILARFDRSVPFRLGELLRERAGRPETLVVPAGHYSAILFLPLALSRMVSFFETRLR